jgi:hypothetical protein
LSIIKQALLAFYSWLNLTFRIYTNNTGRGDKTVKNNFKVPVSAYVKKYLAKKFFNGNKGPIKIEEDTLLGKQFMSIIIDARNKDFIDKHIEYTETIDVILSQDMMSKSPRIHKLVAINFFLDKLFKEALVDWILSAQHYGVRPFPASKDFLAHYGIDENEYSHDAAYKYWTRRKNADINSIYKAKKSSQPSPKIKSMVSQPIATISATV